MDAGFEWIRSRQSRPRVSVAEAASSPVMEDVASWTLTMTTASFPIRESRSALSMPRSISPMLAVLAAGLPSDQDNYSFEFKWDGIRALTYWDGRKLSIRSRNDNEISHRYPELQALTDALEDRKVILDGEIVALDENDQPSFPLLQRRMHIEGKAIQHMVKQVPIYYVIFDLLWIDGKSVMGRPWSQRRQMLEELTLAGPSWRVSPAMVGEGSAALKTALRHRLEGIVAKRIDSVYEAGRRSPTWKKIKLVMSQEFVVGGWSPQQGTTSTIGALHVGYYDGRNPKTFRYAGAIGTGYKAADLAMLSRKLKEISTSANPFADKLPRKQIHFVDPKLVVEVEYRRWPANGLVQQAAYKGVRTDKRASQVVREDPRCSI
jgi:bifunctional non-homologous end joining protein LigD